MMAAGMQLVVAMGYSVTVSAARLMMAQLYHHLFADKALPEAIRLARRELWMQKGRQAYFNQSIDLEDWLLPVVYCNRTVSLNLRQFTAEEEEAYYAQRQQQYRFSPPAYGFVGRDLEILQIEKALLRHNVLLLRGMGGTGKTTLLNYLRQWWQTTDFAEEIFYFGYDQRAWTVAQLRFEIGQRLYDRFERARFQAMQPAAQQQKLVAKLRAGRYVLMLDNLESVTGQALAIQNTLAEPEREELRQFLAQLVGGHSRILLGSRSDETWLQAETFRHNQYDLAGLDPESRSQLAERILVQQVHPAQQPAIREAAAFQRLMTLLAGYPLAMEVVLANLKRQSADEILAGLQAADIHLDEQRDSGDKTRSILHCVEYSHSNLSPQAQQLLLCLAPFSGFIDRSDLPRYAEQLQQFEPLQDYAFDQFDRAIEEAIHWGLLSPMKEGERLLAIQPVLPYFLKTCLQQLDPAIGAALEQGFKQHYQGLAGSYHQWMQSKDPQERQLGLFFCRLEYENLYQALQICLQQQESVLSFFNCLVEYFERTGNVESELTLLESLAAALDRYPPAKTQGELGEEVVRILGQKATLYLETKQYDRSRESYHQFLDRLETLGTMAEPQKQSLRAVTYHNLGRVAQETRQWQRAQHYYQQALAICVKFGDRHSQARTYHQLGSMAQETRQWQRARHYYQQALAIKVEFGDRYNQAGTYHQLGRVAQETRQWQQARHYYQQAIAIYVEFGDRHSQAGTYHQLGRVAQAEHQWQQAQHYYQQALAIKVEFGDRYNQASTYGQLGILAGELRQWDQARHYYQQALAIFVEFGDRYNQASTYHQLGMVAQAERQWQQARDYYQQALAIYVEFGDRYEQVGTYHQLGRVAEALGEQQQAKANYLQALQLMVEFDDEHTLGIIWRSLARVYRATGDESLLAAAAPLLGVTLDVLKQQFLAEGNGEQGTGNGES